MTRIVRHTTDIKRHKAFILSVDSTYIENATARTSDGLVNVFSQPINRYPHELFLEDAQSYLAIREREWCDNSIAYIYNELARDNQVGAYLMSADGTKKKGDPKYKQLLPYMIARQKQTDGTYLYFPYRRLATVGELRLIGNGSLGYGGHIDLADVVSIESVIDLEKTILNSAKREAMEEFKLKNEYGWELPKDFFDGAISFGDLFIVDNSNDVGELHLGIIMYFDVPQGWTLEASEDELAKLPPMTAEQMLADPIFKPENWTLFYLQHVTSKTSFDYAELCAGGKEDVLAIDHGGVQVGFARVEDLADYDPAKTTADAINAVLETNSDAIQSTIPAGWTNNVDWNNAIQGSPANAIELKTDEVKATIGVTNAVSIEVDTDKTEE